MTGFDRLHPALQHHVVNSLGWRTLRPLQEAAIDPLLDGEHALLLAPTAGGKTEAAVLPLFSRMLSEPWQGLSMLYVCPLRALLNNLHVRLEVYGRLIGRRVELWHGDVGPSARRRIVAEPPDCLLTTPESLEVMLISRREDRHSLFENLRAIVVDEVHAFAGDDRGWHLLAVLERLTKLAGREIQRVGLSATVGNAPGLLDWLAGHCDGPRRVIDVAATLPTRAQVVVDSVGTLSNAATVISRLHRGEKRLVFCDSRSRVEELARNLGDAGVQTFVSHGSLSLDERRRAEAAFSHGSDCVIVATSTLELGLDVGDLDRVIQIDSPATVASFLQRVGRTGRRAGATRNCLFLATDDEALLRACALLLLWDEGYVEPVVPPREPVHILAQQIMALALQEGGIGRADWQRWLMRLPAFAGDPPLVESIIAFMLDHGLLSEDQGLMWLGRKGEQRFGHKHFLELFSVFVSEPLFTVRAGRTDVGYVHQTSFLGRRGDEDVVLVLAGQGWVVRHIDWKGRVAYVEPSAQKGRSRWRGNGIPLSARICDAMRRILLGAKPDVQFSQRATNDLDGVRKEYEWLGENSGALRSDGATSLRWWTFAGLKANRGLSAALKHLSPRADNLGLTFTGPLRGEITAGIAVAKETPPEALLPEILDADLDGLKFAECLPQELAKRVAALRAGDPDGAALALRNVSVGGSPEPAAAVGESSGDVKPF